MDSKTLEDILDSNSDISSNHKFSDRVSNVLETLAGVIPDLIAGYSNPVVLINRSISAMTAYISGPIYGEYLDKQYQKNNLSEDSNWKEKFYVDWKVFNAIQTTSYFMTSLTTNSIYEYFHTNTISSNSLYKSLIGTSLVFGISFLASPIKRAYTHTFRWSMGVNKSKEINKNNGTIKNLISSYIVNSKEN